ncbi:MAG: hypothetical protein ACJ0HZ_06565 [Woeseiaceae bacterium]
MKAIISMTAVKKNQDQVNNNIFFSTLYPEYTDDVGFRKKQSPSNFSTFFWGNKTIFS